MQWRNTLSRWRVAICAYGTMPSIRRSIDGYPTGFGAVSACAVDGSVAPYLNGLEHAETDDVDPAFAESRYSCVGSCILNGIL